MFKFNKKLILMIIFILTIGILVGCSSQPKAPEGVNQEFYDDMVECLKKLAKHKNDDENNGIDVVEHYLEYESFLNTTKEVKIVKAMDDLYFWVDLYYYSAPEYSIVKSKVQDVAELMEIEIDIDKLLAK